MNEEVLEAMNEAAEAAESELRDKLAQNPAWIEFCKFHQSWYMKAGHKRLGRLYCKIAKEEK